MNFKTRKLLMSFIFLFIAPLSLQAEQSLQAQPFGIIFRPQLIDSLITELSSRERAFSIDRCFRPEDLGLEGVDFFEEIHIRGSSSFELGEAVWDSSENERLKISIPLISFQFQGQAKLSCQEAHTETFQIAVSRPHSQKTASPSSVIPMVISFDPVRFEEHLRYSEPEVLSRFFWIDPVSVNAVLSQFKVEIQELPEVSRVLNSSSLKSFLISLGLDRLLDGAFDWLLQQMSNLRYAQRISDILENRDIWESGIRFQRQGFQIENDLSRSRLKELTFTFFPRSENFLFLNNSGFELYFNSTFLSGLQVRELLAAPSETIERSFPSMNELENFLMRSQAIPDAKFSRPRIPSQNADISLFLTEELINDALMNIYLENFLQFTTRVDIAAQTKELISSETGPLEIRVDLGSFQPPNLRFESDQLRLRVSDYYLGIGTFIEDRVIPSTQVLAQADAVAELVLDSDSRTLNLSVSPDTFHLNLGEAGRFKRKLENEDLRLIENIANELWEDFFASYPELVLFPSMIDFEKMALELSDVKVNNGMILIDFQLDRESLPL